MFSASTWLEESCGTSALRGDEALPTSGRLENERMAFRFGMGYTRGRRVYEGR
jgi:hypothetical protein